MSLVTDLAKRLGLVERYIRNLVKTASYQYRTYHIPKRRGGFRRIDHPSAELKSLQRAIALYYISTWPVHPAATAYRPGHNNILRNATLHKNSDFLLRMDFEDFFPSITTNDLNDYLTAREPGWDTDDRDVFIRLVLLDGRLTIGAPSSPSLSNAICFELDQQLTEIARIPSVAYTRYADDIYFSAQQPNVLSEFPSLTAEVLGSLAFPRGLRINHQKTRHASRCKRRRVTGLTLGSDKQVHAGRYRKRMVRALVHKLPQLGSADRRRLVGLLAFLRDIDPEFINSLVQKYGHERVKQAMDPE